MNISPADVVCSSKIGRKSALPKEIEDELAEYSIIMEERYYGLTRRDVRRMAYQLAVRNGISHPFSEKDEEAGKKWL